MAEPKYNLLTDRQKVEIVQARLVQAEAALFNTRLNIAENEATGNEAAQDDLRDQEGAQAKQVAFYKTTLDELRSGNDQEDKASRDGNGA